jgi:hypothetical protein
VKQIAEQDGVRPTTSSTSPEYDSNKPLEADAGPGSAIASGDFGGVETTPGFLRRVSGPELEALIDLWEVQSYRPERVSI